MSGQDPYLNEKNELHQIEDDNNFPIYSKEEGTFIYNDGSSMYCNTLSSPLGKIGHDKIIVLDDDLL
jgi:hypothetical protein